MSRPQPSPLPLVALFRGINVGGRNVLKMADLRDLLRGLGLHDVQTYIQSGNVVFRMDDADAPGSAGAGERDLAALRARIEDAVEAAHGFRPRVLVLGGEELLSAIAANPYPEAMAEPKTLHLFFLEQVASEADLDTLNELRRDGERFALFERVFYLHAPAGIGRSKLASKVERALGVAATARNGRSVAAIGNIVAPPE